MTLECTGCGLISENEKDIRYCTQITHENGDPCGSLMLPIAVKKTIEAVKPRKEGK
jgi:hypothetical protein